MGGIIFVMVNNPLFPPHTYGYLNPVSPLSFYNALINVGFSPNAAAGLTGNAIYESGGNANTIYLNPPTGANSGDAAVGSMQFEGSRGLGIAPTLDSQVQHICNEISSGSQGLTLSQINSASSPSQAAAMVNTLYERPQYPNQSMSSRQSYANQVASMASGNGGSIGSESFSPGDQSAPSDMGPNAVSDQQLNLLQGYYGGTQQDAYGDYQTDLVDGSAPTTADLNSISSGAPSSGTGNSISAMTPDQAAAMGLNPDGSPLGASSDGGISTSLPGPLGAMFGGSSGNQGAGVLGSIGSGSLGALGSGSAGGTGTPSTGGAGLGDTSSGVPVYLTDIAAAGGKGAGPQIQSGLNKVASTSASDIASLNAATKADVATGVTAGTSWTQDFLNAVYDTIPRVLVGFASIILLGMGIWLVGKNEIAKAE